MECSGRWKEERWKQRSRNNLNREKEEGKIIDLTFINFATFIKAKLAYS